MTIVGTVLAVYINKNIILLQESCQLWRFSLKIMEKNVYFKGISEKVHETRTKGEYTAEELRIFEEGKCEALRSVLMDFHPENADIWQKHLYTSRELQDFILLEYKDLVNRLKKARQIYLQQQKTVLDLTQLQIP